MRWSGPLIAAFAVYHLLQLTVGSAHPDFKPGDVYHNVIVAFSSWPVCLFDSSRRPSLDRISDKPLHHSTRT